MIPSLLSTNPHYYRKCKMCGRRKPIANHNYCKLCNELVRFDDVSETNYRPDHSNRLAIDVTQFQYDGSLED